MARLTHVGLFRTKPTQDWQEIKGQEYFAVAMPEFIWKAATPSTTVSVDHCS
jgi:hypothetical protein